MTPKPFEDLRCTDGTTFRITNNTAIDNRAEFVTFEPSKMTIKWADRDGTIGQLPDIGLTSAAVYGTGQAIVNVGGAADLRATQNKIAAQQAAANFGGAISKALAEIKVKFDVALEEQTNMRALYEVYLVNRETLAVIFERVVAKSDSMAVLKVALQHKIEVDQIEDYAQYCAHIMDIDCDEQD